MLRIIGENFDVDKFISKSAIIPYNKFHKGDPKFKTKPNGSKIERSGCSIKVSKADFESFERQIHDTITYLDQNKEKLQWINKTPEIQYAVLDFGLNYDSDKFVQSHYLPNEFLKLVSELGIGIEISIYQSTDELTDN